MNMKILVTWVGHADLRALAVNADDKLREIIADEIGSLDSAPEGLGPVRTLVEEVSFDRILILSNYTEAVTKAFLDWLPGEAEEHQTNLDNPTDYGDIFRVVNQVLHELTNTLKGKDYDLSIHLSPGTPAMAAVWVLLGKTRYPATFYQSFKGDVWETEIPFELTLNMVSEIFSESDSRLQHLSALSPSEIPGFQDIVGSAKSIRLAVGRAQKAAIRDVPVLLLGESGTGKEMFARAIHAASHRKDQPFEVVNCAALPKTLLESELFGHEKGAFTGAEKQYKGAFERADGGILFLDEIGECDPETQVKLLRVLQPSMGSGPCNRTFRRLGGKENIAVNVRVLAATNQNLIEAIATGRFREDLFYRLAVISIRLPALRHRKSDVAKLAEQLLKQINADFAKYEPGFEDKIISSSAKSFLSSQAWPGNVRQLYNCLLQAAAMSDQAVLEPVDFQMALAETPTIGNQTADLIGCPLGDGFNVEDHLAEIQRQFLVRAMKEANGVKTKAASLLGLKNYQTLDAQLKRLNVDWEKA
ncbi:MAG: sigma 54-interacting transcriptional regulator [Lentisphaeria bacterium]|nr:sigma 54-interacting transcriptional regulator [Lentisphaeria bacterium]